MKILGTNKKQKIIKVRVTNADDLWHLSKVIEPLDLVYGQTTRKIKLGQGKDEKSRAVKKTISLEIQVNKIGFDSHILALRIHGKTTKEREDIPLGSSHTIEVEPGTEIKIIKNKWKDFQISRLKDAESSSIGPKVLVCVLDDEQANIALLGAAGIKYLSKVNLRLAKKRIKEKREKPFDELAKDLVSADKQENPGIIVIASPLFWKDEFLKVIGEKASTLKKKIKLENVSTGSRRGVEELLKSKALNDAIKQGRLQKETKLVDKLLKEIAKDELAVYGIRDVKKASKQGAVEILLVTDKNIEKARQDNRYEDLENLLEQVEQNKGEIHIIGVDHEAGKKLQGLGGISAILRFRIE